MAGGGEEKEYHSVDPVAAAGEPTAEEPVATEPLRYVVTGSESSISDRDPEKEKRPVEDLRKTTTTRTTSTGFLSTRSGQDEQEDEERKAKAWYKRLNPLKSRHKPPVPKERTVSREYGASFLSALTFQWMAPLMRVSAWRSATTLYNADGWDLVGRLSAATRVK